jgi:hypothetical protein
VLERNDGPGIAEYATHPKNKNTTIAHIDSNALNIYPSPWPETTCCMIIRHLERGL